MASHINQSSGLPTGAALQGMIADLAADHPELLLAMRDMVTRPAFQLLIASDKSGRGGILHRDVLINELRPIFSAQVLEALIDLIDGMLDDMVTVPECAETQNDSGIRDLKVFEEMPDEQVALKKSGFASAAIHVKTHKASFIPILATLILVAASISLFYLLPRIRGECSFRSRIKKLSYSQLTHDIAQGRISRALFSKNQVLVVYNDGEVGLSIVGDSVSEKTIKEFQSSNVTIAFQPPPDRYTAFNDAVKSVVCPYW